MQIIDYHIIDHDIFDFVSYNGTKRKTTLYMDLFFVDIKDIYSKPTYRTCIDFILGV